MQTYSEYAPTGFDNKGAFLREQGDWLVLIGRNRDSDHLAESNFEQALEALGGESDNVEVHRFGHWACGWLEVIIVRPDTAAATIAEEIEASLADYPVLNDDDYSKREYEAYQESWESWGRRDFIRELVSKFDLDEENEEALEEVDTYSLQEFFELLNPSGDYYDSEGANIMRSIRKATLDDVTDFLATYVPPTTGE